MIRPCSDVPWSVSTNSRVASSGFAKTNWPRSHRVDSGLRLVVERAPSLQCPDLIRARWYWSQETGIAGSGAHDEAHGLNNSSRCARSAIEIHEVFRKSSRPFI